MTKSQLIYHILLNLKLFTTISYEITNKTWGYYTGDGEKLALLGLELQGLDEGLKNYV